ncbi:hypothetical protein C4552_03195 [Candidatus Parcubacteria bacterium]|nr:MAG: hypothetical protein C4552_03195 [Candidatus Parcubacteria bacterium]
MATTPSPSYLFTRSQQSIFAEVLFPKKVVYQREIYGALENGLSEEKVKDYLQEDINALMREMRDYRHLFDPLQYERNEWSEDLVITEEQALQRVAMYQSHFRGWSMYEADGVFSSEETGQVYDERTQVIRLIFRLESSFTEVARAAECSDVLQVIIRWVMDMPRVNGILPWSQGEQSRFFAQHGQWPAAKRAFAEQHYEALAKEVQKWVDDTGLFVFGYLIRRFWQVVVTRQLREEEIWAVSFWNAHLNIVKRVEETAR